MARYALRRAAKQPRTLLHILFDVALLFIGLFLSGVVLSAITNFLGPYMPMLQMILSLEQNPDTTFAQRQLFASSNAPDIVSAVMSVLVVTIISLLVFLILYALLKTFVWSSVKRHKFRWRYVVKMMLITLGWGVVLAALPFALMGINPTIAAYILILLLLLTAFFLPLSFVRGVWNFWRPLALLRRYMFHVLLLVLLWFLGLLLLMLMKWLNAEVALLLILLWYLIFLAFGRYYIAHLMEVYDG